MTIPETHTRRNVLKASTPPVADACAYASQRPPTGPRNGRVLKKGAFFVGSILFSLVLLTLSCTVSPADAAARHVSGGGGGRAVVYTHISTSANSTYDYTDLDNAVTNNNPKAFVIVTPNYSPYGVYNDHLIGVWYHSGKWSIFNQDRTPIPVNAAFNVYASDGYGFIHIATAANSQGDFTNVDLSEFAPTPQAILIVTPNYSPYGVYDNHLIGVWYHNGIWSIFNQDRTPIPVNAAFNVVYTEPFASTPQSGALVHTATTANSAGDYTDITSLVTNNTPSNVIFVTPRYNPSSVYETHTIGVWYHAGKWSIFNQDRTPIPLSAAFSVYGLEVIS